jgi:amidophosphoribosyltransferase
MINVESMKVIILAAGRSVELADLTKDKPKCLLEIGNQTILSHQIKILRECKFRDENIFVVAGYKSEKIHIKNIENIIYSYDYDKTDNAHSLYLALQKIGTKNDIIILDSDLIFTSTTIERIIAANYENSLLVHNEQTGVGDTGIIVDKNGRVIEIGKHIKSTEYFFAGILTINQASCDTLFNLLQSGIYKTNWYTVPLNKCLLSAPFFMVKVADKDDIYEINTYNDYIKAKKQFGERRKKILLTGASGLLGEKLFDILNQDFELTGIRKSTTGKYTSLNLTNEEEVQAFVIRLNPDIIIHTAAIADPDICEQNKELAYITNVVATQNLSRICRMKSIKMVLISTDYVFDGDKNSEYLATDERKPKNYYGLTKVQAEDIVAKLPENLIIRIPILYGYNNDEQTHFLTKTLNMLNKSEELSLDNNQIRYPVLADEIAVAIKQLIDQQGIVQISSSNSVTKASWGSIIVEEFGLSNSLINPVCNNINLVGRPHHVKMDTTRADSLGIYVSNIHEGISIVKNQINCVFKMIYKSHTYEKLFNVNVGKFRYDLGKKLAEGINLEIYEDIDYIIPVPNSGLYYAMGFAEIVKKTYVQALVISENQSRSFDIIDLSSRKKVIDRKIIPTYEFIENKNIILVDEAIFTGTTLKMVCDMLKASGAANIHICIPTPICVSRCKYYIQPDRQLLSEYIAFDDFSDYFGVKTVNFLDYNVFIDVLKTTNRSMCFYCFQDLQKK